MPNTRRRIATKKTSLEVNKSDERTVAVTTQESVDGVREKAMRIVPAWISCRKAAVQEDPVQGELRMTGTRKSVRLRGPLRVEQQVKAVEKA